MFFPKISASPRRPCPRCVSRKYLTALPRNASVITTRPVPLASTAAIDTSEAFQALASSPRSTPLLFSEKHISNGTDIIGTRARDLMHALRHGEDKLVEVELGRYDDTAFDRIPMRLGQYLDWLESTNRRDGKIGSQQVYLAQWRGNDEVPMLGDIVVPPPLLQTLLLKKSADLYQTSFFIGPASAVSPLHYDPYLNFYHFQASSERYTHAKHFILIPPSASQYIKRPSLQTSLRNTSPINLQLRYRGFEGSSVSNYNHTEVEFDVLADWATPKCTVEAISGAAFSCLLREGESLFIPRRWWHRVENVSLPESGQSLNSSTGWSAGIGWWFLFRP